MYKRQVYKTSRNRLIYDLRPLVTGYAYHVKFIKVKTHISEPVKDRILKFDHDGKHIQPSQFPDF